MFICQTANAAGSFMNTGMKLYKIMFVINHFKNQFNFKMKLRFLLLGFSVVSISFSLSAKEWIISDSNLEVKFNDNLGTLTVLDKRCNKTWEQIPFKDNFSIGTISQKGKSLYFILNGTYDLGITITLSDKSYLVFILSADSAAQMNELSFPSAFKTPGKNHYLVDTDGEGMLLPVDDKDYPLGNGITYYCGGGLSMAWMGIVDDNFRTGYMAILETPYDAALRTLREDGLITFSTVWLPSMGRFGYDRKVTYHFLNEGGYVAQCKLYREYIWKKNGLKTLKEKQRRFPAIAKLIGSPNIYVWDDARESDFAKELKSSGINKAFILWDPNHTPYPETGYDDKLKDLGFASGVYDLYTDIHYRDTVLYEKDVTGPLRFSRTGYPGLFYQLSAKRKDGKTYFNSYGHTICPATIRPFIQDRIEHELKEYPHETYFLDVYQANGLFECYSPQHPLTREQYAGEILKNYRMIEDKYNQYIGGEWGADFANQVTVYNHGMMTLQRTWFGSDITKRGTIYYYGDWRNNPRPSIMLSSRVAPDKYLKYSINEYIRVPLYELVYHDAVISSWRWEDANHHTPEIWWKKDLFNILYGSAPLWSIDRNRWESYKNTFIQSYKNICPWLEQIGYDEMISHRFITPDHLVQETVFSSGKRAVINFGTDEFVFEGTPVKPKSFLLFQN
jgi:hypothetical protein